LSTSGDIAPEIRRSLIQEGDDRRRARQRISLVVDDGQSRGAGKGGIVAVLDQRPANVLAATRRDPGTAKLVRIRCRDRGECD
jgi:hypothetical protein